MYLHLHDYVSGLVPRQKTKLRVHAVYVCMHCSADNDQLLKYCVDNLEILKTGL